jgi:hypothetical protein
MTRRYRRYHRLAQMSANVSTPVLSPSRVRGFEGGQNVWAKVRFGALGCAGWPSPPAPLPPPLIPRKRGLWERGDSGGRLRHPIAVHGQCEHLFGPPLNAGGGGYDMSEKDAYFLLIP